MSIESKILKKLKYFNLKNTPEYLEELVIDTTEDIKQGILNMCNLEEFPKELNHVVVYRVLGEIISHLNSVGKLEMEDVEIGRTLSSITRGDVSMSYQGKSTSDNLEDYFNYLKNYGRKEIYNFRRIKW